MTTTILGNPDVYVQWQKTDEPGENPSWNSQCGRIVQTSFGDNPIFEGFVGADQTPISPKYTLASAKTAVETQFTKSNSLVWAYADYED